MELHQQCLCNIWGKESRLIVQIRQLNPDPARHRCNYFSCCHSTHTSTIKRQQLKGLQHWVKKCPFREVTEPQNRQTESKTERRAKRERVFLTAQVCLDVLHSAPLHSWKRREGWAFRRETIWPWKAEGETEGACQRGEREGREGGRV